MKKFTILTLLLLPFFGNAQSIEKFSIDSGGASATAGNIQILYTIGEVMVQERSAGNIQVSEGFINPTSLKLTINPKVFLEGPSMSTAGIVTMGDDLRQSGVIPLNSPFPDALQAVPAVFTVTGNDAIVDWIYISLMDKNDRSIEIASTSAFLQVDGDIVGVNGISSVAFNVGEDDYFLRIVHRNHLAILTSNPITLTTDATVIDLTSDPLAIFGGVNAVNEVGGAFAMVSGDVVSNGQVQFEDANAVLQQLGAAGYTNEDTDLSGQIQFADYTLFTLPNLGRGIQF